MGFALRKGLLRMKLLDFNHDFPDERTCRLYFKEIRDRTGIVCKKCNGDRHRWMPVRQMFHCQDCGRRMSLRSGTVMENSKLPFRVWFMAMHLMCATKRNIPALEVQRQLGHKYYEPVWAMMHKIRRSMGNLDAKLSRELGQEISQVAFPVMPKKAQLGRKKKENVNHLPSKMAVMVTAEIASKECVGPRSTNIGMLEWLKLEAVPLRKELFPRQTHGSKTLGQRSYRKLVKNYWPPNQPKKAQSKPKPCIGIVLDNARNRFFPTYYGISDVYLQNYLNEFCFMLNRRKQWVKMFELLAEAMSVHWKC